MSDLGCVAQTHPDVPDALRAAAAATDGPVVVAGSFLTVAAALSSQEILQR